MAATTETSLNNANLNFDFSCTFERFSRRVGPRRAYLPPIPNFPEEWYLELKYNRKSLKVTLFRLSVKCKPYLLESNIYFRSFSSPRIHSERVSISVYDDKNCILAMQKLSSDLYWWLIDLPKDTLILEGHFSITLAKNLTSVSHNDSFELQSALVANLKKMYLKQSGCDITFIVEDQELKAHKSILESQSVVFAEIFKHYTRGKNSKCMDIEDISFQVFDCFLYFLYSAEIKDNDWDTVIALYSTADKYHVPSLRKVCGRILSSNFTVENICSALIIFYKHSDDFWQNTAIGFILLHLEEVLSTEEWKSLEQYPDLLTEILKTIAESDKNEAQLH